MSEWQLVPEEISGVLKEVDEYREDLNAAVSPFRLETVFEYLSWGGGLTAEVSAAVDLLLADQQDRLTRIGNRVDAGRVGVALAVAAYEAGADEMYDTVQSEMLATAVSGDFSYFEPFLEPPS